MLNLNRNLFRMTIIDAIMEALIEIDMFDYKLSSNFSRDTKLATVPQT